MDDHNTYIYNLIILNLFYICRHKNIKYILYYNIDE